MASRLFVGYWQSLGAFGNLQTTPDAHQVFEIFRYKGTPATPYFLVEKVSTKYNPNTKHKNQFP
jgi:hypothetical protein